MPESAGGGSDIFLRTSDDRFRSPRPGLERALDFVFADEPALAVVVASAVILLHASLLVARRILRCIVVLFR